MSHEPAVLTPAERAPLGPLLLLVQLWTAESPWPRQQASICWFYKAGYLQVEVLSGCSGQPDGLDCLVKPNSVTGCHMYVNHCSPGKNVMGKSLQTVLATVALGFKDIKFVWLVGHHCDCFT